MSYHPYQPYPSQYPPSPYGPAYPPRASAPFSVHVVAFFMYLGATTTLLGAIALVLVGVGALSSLGASEVSGGAAVGVMVVAALIALVISLLYFGWARSLQKGRQWARVLVLIFCVLGLIGTVVQAFALSAYLGSGDPAIWAPALLGAIGPILFLILLNTSAARSWFRYQTY